MIRTDLLRQRITEHGLTQAHVAQRLGMTTRTFYKRMKAGVFRSDELEEMMAMLGIEDPRMLFGSEANIRKHAADL
ncbi:MAG: helix-turn-helix domain-containing protein [Clostridia bacterium]